MGHGAQNRLEIDRKRSVWSRFRLDFEGFELISVDFTWILERFRSQVIRSGQFEALNGSVQDFVAFRRQAENSDLAPRPKNASKRLDVHRCSSIFEGFR